MPHTHFFGQIENQKLDFKAQSKVGSLDNVKHKPGGGEIKIFDDKEYIKQVGGQSPLPNSHNQSRQEVRRRSRAYTTIHSVFRFVSFVPVAGFFVWRFVSIHNYLIFVSASVLVYVLLDLYPTNVSGDIALNSISTNTYHETFHTQISFVWFFFCCSNLRLFLCSFFCLYIAFFICGFFHSNHAVIYSVVESGSTVSTPEVR